MKIDPAIQVCASCRRPAADVPLIPLAYQSASYWICPQCLPVLIHAPQKLVGKLPNAERLGSVPKDGYAHH